jgi:hypothetical protein
VHAPPGLAIQLQQRARPVLHERFGAASCIESTAAAIDVLRAGGIWVQVLAVTVLVFNAAGWQLHVQGIVPGLSTVEMAVWSLYDAWAAGIGTGTDLPGVGVYGGHLVTLVENRWLLDLAIDQASRPDHGVTLSPLLVAIEPSQLASDGAVIHLSDGTVLVYQLNLAPWAGAYRHMQAWTDKRQRAEVASAVRATLGA